MCSDFVHQRPISKLIVYVKLFIIGLLAFISVKINKSILIRIKLTMQLIHDK